MLHGAVQELQCSCCSIPAPAGTQGTRNDLDLMENDVIGVNAALWLHTAFVTAPVSLVGPRAALPLNRQFPSLALQGETLKLEGKVVESKWLCLCPGEEMPAPG